MGRYDDIVACALGKSSPGGANGERIDCAISVIDQFGSKFADADVPLWILFIPIRLLGAEFIQVYAVEAGRALVLDEYALRMYR